ncbi:hypothetical protein LY78DRAFT_126803 [Colletotrichum sublineola]|nr:hypothetical protein LY78DRAFT_126803 [Colletotrichum sublineola]
MQRKVVWHRHQSDKLRETWISCTSGHCSSAACFPPPNNQTWLFPSFTLSRPGVEVNWQGGHMKSVDSVVRVSLASSVGDSLAINQVHMGVCRLSPKPK